MAAEPIAVIGSGCRFPGSSSSQARLWDLLKNPKNVASKVPAERFNVDAFYHPNGDNHGTTNARESYFLTEDIRKFDAPFFNISASEADCIDPQQRVLMETVYESLETAGLRLQDLQGSNTGVFAGVMCGDYGDMLYRDVDCLPRYTATGTARSIISNRISYFFDWHGPSMTIDTACSSSLIAVHLAAKALHDGDCRVAIAAGTNLILAPSMYISESKLNMLSPHGRSRMWDADADGYARGEGVAAVTLKRLSDAIADGDHIDCVIRATHTNQDGRSMGITMPSSEAQTDLIRTCYAKAGLDIAHKASDRCQYFEAHGTGTPAGDPQEASAIFEAFFPESNQDGLMHVGSVKTVIGHTEGTAGLAGLLKASMALQNGIIPPNMHFKKPNPKLTSYLNNLRVPTKAMKWPELPAGVPRRASVNSFGFGGSNAHVILEEYTGNTPASKSTNTPAVLPFSFSATSEKTLGAVLESFATWLRTHSEVDPVDLAWSLATRRAAFAYRLTIAASSIEDLKSKIQEEMNQRKSNNNSTIASRPTAGEKKILAVFTGQGAQWPQMGLDLIRAAPIAATWFQELQTSLDELPENLRPSYNLLEELAAPKEKSRLSEALLSQPLCTAVQIVLIKFLRALGIRFSAVTGHSSGEISGAYAGGFINESEAIRIAHLRGHFAKLAAGASGQKGGMLAAGMSLEEATDLCETPEFNGKVKMAASNSPSSVTFSGDAEAIKELEEKLKAEGKFARALKVDTAYHSHHMHPCSQPYIDALNACNIRPSTKPTARWFSSVYNGNEITGQSSYVLKNEYWKDNMVNAVLFSQALTEAINTEDYDMILEVGPHPALKGPATQTISEVSNGGDIPYTGVLSRGNSSIEAMAAAIGQLWTYLGVDMIDLGAYAHLFDTKKLTFVNDLPTYPFDHTQSYWSESRVAKSYLQRNIPPNMLLGALSTENTDGEWRWRNYLRREEIGWLDGHQVQTQTVFPATGYVAMVLEAVKLMNAGKAVRLIEVFDMVIDNAIAVPDDPAGVEVLFKVDGFRSFEDSTTANWACHANQGGSLRHCASGSLAVIYGESDNTALPKRGNKIPGMSGVNVEEFYLILSMLGYGYSGHFQSVKELERQKGRSTGLLNNVSLSEGEDNMMMHPALMDTVLQGLLAAVGDPRDGELYTMHIPTSIGRIRINPHFCGSNSRSMGELLPFDADIGAMTDSGTSGDADLFDSEGNGVMQVERVKVSPLMAPTEEDDRLLFSNLKWGRMHPDASVPYDETLEVKDQEAELSERVALLYIRDVYAQLTEEDVAKFDWHRKRIYSWWEHVLSLTKAGTHPVLHKEWLEGTVEGVVNMYTGTRAMIDIETMHVVGKQLLPFFRFETTILEHMRENNLLDRFYVESVDLAPMNPQLGHVAGQIAYRFPRMKILEIGGGTGSATLAAFKEMGRAYQSYTFTDISAAFFEPAQELLHEHIDRITFKVLDIEKDPLEQGFEAGTYDLVIASNVLHATKSLRTTMSNVRKILKPGGRVLTMEGTDVDCIRVSFNFCGFEGWWLGEQDNRVWGPMSKASQWDAVLRDSGFDGLETITPNHDIHRRMFSVFVSQAVDDTQLQLLRPLEYVPEKVQHEKFVIVGGATEKTAKLSAEIQKLIKPFAREIIAAPDLKSLDIGDATLVTTIQMTELDDLCFKEMESEAFYSLQKLTVASRSLLWVTGGDDAAEPHLATSRGVLRCLAYENPHSRYQHFNIDSDSDVNAKLIAEMALRFSHPDTENDYKLPTRSWSIEPEVRLKDGFFQLGRFCKERPIHDRYMAARRPIFRQHDPQADNMCINEMDGLFGFDVKAMPTVRASEVRVKVNQSTLSALRVEGGAFFRVVIGTNTATNAQVLALTDQHAHIISIPASMVIPCDVPAKDGPAFVAATAHAITAETLLGLTKPNTSLLVHEADASLRYALSMRASAYKVKPYFSTADENNHFNGAIFLHDKSSLRRLEGQIPRNITATATFDQNPDSIFNRVLGLLPHHVYREDFASLHQGNGEIPPGFNGQLVTGLLSTASKEARRALVRNKTPPLITVQALCKQARTYDSLRVIDWSQTGHVSVRVARASSSVKLSPSKTYLLVGLTGDLGRSVCHWMITRGARNVVLTSRNPKIVPPWWLEQMTDLGARVVPMAMDVTSAESVFDVDCAIRRDMPPVGGVVSGAVIVSDILFSDMTHETMMKTLGPKVDGTVHLNNLYGEDDLDFFIAFGSAAGPSGNRGQTAYAGANTFMSHLIRGRRERGLVGSTINPAEVRSVGYVSRMGEQLSDVFYDTLGCLPVSELDLHELFAEAILAGNPDSGRNGDIIAGPIGSSPVEKPNVIWYWNPKMWNFVNDFQTNTSNQSGGDSVPLKTQLEDVTTMAEVLEIVQAGLINKIRHKLHLSEEDVITPDTPLIELGIDSLVAVDLRTWFVKELSVDMPVLKILGGSPIGELAEDATSKVPASLIPNVQEGESVEEAAKKVKAAEKAKKPEAKPKEEPKKADPKKETKKEIKEGKADPPSLPQLKKAKQSDGEPLTTASTNGSLTPEESSDHSSARWSESEDSEIEKHSPLPIDKTKFEKITKLSFAQSRFWFLHQFLDDKSAYNVTFLIKLDALPNVTKFEEAVRQLGQRHETLRTCYLPSTDDEKDPLQAILPETRLHLEKSHITSDKEINSEWARIRDHIYDLENGEVARFRLVTTPEKHQYLLAGYHHIALDAASFHVMLGELVQMFNKQTLPAPSRQYPDYAAAERQAWDRGEMRKDVEFWKSEFDTIPEPVGLLPMAKTTYRTALKKYDLEEINENVSAATMKKVAAACKKARATPFHFFLAVLRVFMARQAGAEDFCIGVVDANRMDPLNQTTVGFLLNLLPVRFRTTDSQTAFKDIVADSRAKAFGAMSHSRVPFNNILEELAVPRSAAYSPLFQVMIDWQPQSGTDHKFGGINSTVLSQLTSQTAYDLTLLVAEEASGECKVNFRMQKSLYSGSGAKALVKSFMALFNSFADNLDTKVGEGNLYEQVDLEQATQIGRGPSHIPSWPSTISRRVDEIAQKYINKTAVKDADGLSYTYEQLNARTNQLAAVLREQGVKTNSPVCMFQHPTGDWIACMLAIWKLNATYVPLDLRNPTARLATMVQECQPQVILCRNDTADDVKNLGSSAKVINTEQLKLNTSAAEIDNLSKPESRAVILFTSGTTGKPKGIQLAHSTVANWTEAYTTRWGFGAAIALQQGAMTFDHALDQMVVGLANGGTVIVAPRTIRGDPLSLTKLIVDEKVTYTKATPAEYSNWLTYGHDTLRKALSWKFAVAGGEHLTTSLAARFRALELAELRLLNSYGPGEIISSHKGEIDYKKPKTTEGNVYPAGESVPNYNTYIVDENMKAVPQGVSGEILIGGAGPQLGYLGMDDLNKQKFIQNPYVTGDDVSQGWIKAFRTFDRGHLLEDGQLVIEGRLDGDTMIKLRGIRMELQDIENTIVTSSKGSITNAVVTVRGERTQFLAAHVTFSEKFDKSQSDSYTKQLIANLPLPQYMCPAIIVPVDNFPLTVHGKVDRRAVSEWSLPTVSRSGAAADLSEVEDRLRDIWDDVLEDTFIDKDSIDGETNFFMAGGNSVLLVKLQSTIQEKLGVTVPLMELFEAATLGAMADKVENAKPHSSIDWKAETSIDDITTKPEPAAKKDKDLTIVLTGATGFVGKSLVSQLLASPAVAHVHAVAVRNKDKARALPASSKLTIHRGDLGAPHLGLKSTTFAELSKNADLIIHSGANRSFWDSYATLRPSNVAGTKSLIELAAARAIPIHFLSSGSVRDIADGTQPPNDGSDGYVSTKWASEQLLKNASQRFGLDVVFHRPAEAEKTSPPGAELIEEFRNLVHKLKCVPVEGGWKGTFALMPVAEFARPIVSRATAGTGANGKVDAVTHEATVRMSTDDMVTLIADGEKQDKIDDYERLSGVKWMGRAKREAGFAWLAAAQNATVGDQGMTSRR